MTEAKISRIRNPVYNPMVHPPLPPRIRLAANSWERVWWLTLADNVQSPERLDGFVQRFTAENIGIRAQMRTTRRLCIAVNSKSTDEDAEFEITMTLLAYLERELGAIERVEDRCSSMWPYLEFSV